MGGADAFWGYEKLGVEPMSAGPRGLAVASRSVRCRQAGRRHFRPGDHAGTFGGNPFASRCAHRGPGTGRAVGAAVEQMGVLLQKRLLADLGQPPPSTRREVRVGACCRAWCCGSNARQT